MKTLVITGGSRGIGKATAARFAADGWKIINISRTPCDIAGAINFQIDLRDADALHANLDELKNAAAGSKKIALLHNASIFNQDNIKDLSEESLREVLEFNLVSPQTLNKLFIPIMTAGSSIIFIGSTLSEMGVPGRASYVISKHAIVGMMRSTCQDLRGTGITTGCICPGFVDTTMITDQIDKQTLNQVIANTVIAGRLLAPEEIADFIYFCVHNPSINGSVLHANLGQINN